MLCSSKLCFVMSWYSHYRMLCCVVLCYATLCHVMWRFAMFCCIVLSFLALCCVVLHYLYYAVLCVVMASHVRILSYVLFRCCVSLYDDMLWHVMLCNGM